MYGIVIAFEDYSFRKGVFGSDWVGLKYFIQFFDSPDFARVLKNTLVLSFYQLLVSFPAPIILALYFYRSTDRYCKSVSSFEYGNCK